MNWKRFVAAFTNKERDTVRIVALSHTGQTVVVKLAPWNQSVKIWGGVQNVSTIALDFNWKTNVPVTVRTALELTGWTSESVMRLVSNSASALYALN
jgi:hypothetical protein